MSQQQPISTLVITQNALLATRLARKMTNRLSVHGISLTEYLVMDYLSQAPHGEPSRIELAEHLGMSASGVTRLLAPMEKTGIIETFKNPRDSRQSLVKLSDAGRKLFGEASVSFGHIASDLTDKLSQSQQTKLVEFLGRLL